MQALTYRKYRYWENYLTFFPEAFRRVNEGCIREEWWRWSQSHIHIDRYLPEGVTPAPLKVILLHGGGGYSRLLAPYAELLRYQGYEVVVPDLPGFGLTKSSPKDTDYRRWVELACDLVTKEMDERGTVLMGASLGGMLAYTSAQKCPNVVGVIATTLCDPEQLAVRESFVRHPWLARYLWPLSATVPEFLKKRVRLPIKWFGKMNRIANVPALNKAVSADRLGGGGWLPLSFLDSIFRFQVPVEETSRCPVLLVHPENDHWTPLELSDDFFNKIGGDKRQVLLPGCGHYPVEQQGLSVLKSEVKNFLELLS